jgi:hypothetical protein
MMEDLARILIALAGFGAGALVMWVACMSDEISKMPRGDD